MEASRSERLAVLTPLLIFLSIYSAYSERNNETTTVFDSFVFAFVFYLIILVLLMLSDFFWSMLLIIFVVSGGILVAMILTLIADRLKEEVIENIEEKFFNYLDWFDRLYDKYLSWLPGE
tara:strand:+ start:164 stop:523 length:360 start_codon:yes stop_codon:yes gene_type:complete